MPAQELVRLKRLGAFGTVAVCVVCAMQPVHAQAPGPSTPAERAHFVALVRSLERDPLTGTANATRQQLLDWMIEVPDTSFKVCDDLLGGVVGSDYHYSRVIHIQVALSGAVVTIEDPGEARDDVAVYTAGVEGALRAYQVTVKSTPDARSAVLDDLIKKRDRGDLRAHVARLANENCPRSNGPLIAASMGAVVGLMLALLIARWLGGRGLTVERPPGNITRTATIFRAIVLICVAYYLLVGIGLHVLEPEYDPRFRFMSDYAWGAYGWLMTTTFFVLGLAVLTVAFGLRTVHQSSRIARVGVGLLVVGALFVCLAGVFRGFPLHDVASAVALPSLAMAALFVSWSFRKTPGWQVIHPVTFPVGLGMFAALVSMIADVGMPGLQQRAFLFLLLLWLSIIVHRVVRLTAGHS